MDSLREEWKEKVSWSDNVFNSLERFVDANSQNIDKFLETKDQSSLWQGNPPEPKPSNKHVEYMLEYAEKKYR